MLNSTMTFHSIILKYFSTVEQESELGRREWETSTSLENEVCWVTTAQEFQQAWGLLLSAAQHTFSWDPEPFKGSLKKDNRSLSVPKADHLNCTGSGVSFDFATQLGLFS